MKTKVLLTTLGLGISLIALSSYEDGPAHSGAGNRSGSGGANATCSTAGCHGAQNSNLLLTFSFSDDANGSVVTDGKYLPGHTYTVTLTGVYSGAQNYTHLGFQASVVNTSNANSGTVAPANATITHTSTNGTSGITVIEHSSPIAKTGSQFVASFKWTAPAAGSGNAIVYARMVANNNNGQPGDDTPNAINTTLTEGGTTSIHDIAKSDLFRIYPNPAQNSINLTLNQLKADKYDVSITSLDGKVLMNTKTNFTGGEMQLDISALAKGMYALTLHSENGFQTTRFVKQ